MSNEELAALIRRGQIDLLQRLWDQVIRFVRQEARKWARWKEVEFDDLVQSGYLALVDAAAEYDPALGALFISRFAIHLKKHFSLCRAAASGLTPKKYQGAKERGVTVCSLNKPLPGAEGDGDMELIDAIASPGDAYEEVIERDYNDTLHLAQLPEIDRQVLRLRYYKNLTLADAGAALGLSIEQVRHRQNRALWELRKNRQELEGWIDARTNYHLRVGVRAFRETGYSSVERIAEMREEMRNRLLSGRAVM
jgi:RNA polymerase sigma factor (sigma-70 family)